MNVAILYNLIRKEIVDKNKPLDMIAELDSKETINAEKRAFEEAGHKVILIEANESAYLNLKKYRKKINVVFNVAEGTHGEARRSQIPGMLEMLKIPYVGSDALTQALCLDKAMAKRIMIQHNIPTPRFQVVEKINEKINDLKFPLILKLAHEGSQMGLDENSVVENHYLLRKKLKHLIKTYKEPVLVEEFIQGREFTIPIIGNPGITLPIIEVLFTDEKETDIWEPDESVIPLIEKWGRRIKIPSQEKVSVCPAQIPKELANKLNEIVLRTYDALNCKDFCRIDMIYRNGVPYILELNPTPGIDPSYWFPRSAYAAGMTYSELLDKIIHSAIKRYGIKRGENK
ncbi:ATP-grasp domain-containing protein [Candidatus Woesearchaeota archaeon]|nr:ATP-grasp domain-containing protein [Candidatus Woesearchaeota archaeon]